jgi:phospholipid/cholesterol/gamma-HCH transport system substrate-binding protein
MKISNEVKIGMIVISGVAILVWGLNYLKGKGVFSHTKKIHAIYERVDGLVASNPVRINGFKVGLVEDVQLHPDHSGRLLVSMAVENDIFVPNNSIARIVSTDLIGAKAIDLMLGTGKENIRNDDTLKSDLEPNIKDVVSRSAAPVVAKAQQLLASFDSVLVVVQAVFNKETRDNLSKSFKRINTTIQSIEHASFTLDTLLSTEQNRLKSIFINIESISRNFRDNNEVINRAINNFGAISDSLAKSNLASTIENTRNTLDKTSGILDKINRGEGSLGMLLHNDSLYKNLNAAAADLDALIVDMKENPKRYVQFSVISFGSGKNKSKKAPVNKNGSKQ